VGEGTFFRVAVLPVDRETTGPQAMSPVAARFGEQISLESYAWQVDAEAVHLTLRWSADSYVDGNYAVFAHLIGPDGAERVVSQSDAPPMGGRWPTSLWLPGVALDDVHAIAVPAGLPPDTYEVWVGLYDPVSGIRLPLPDGSDALHLAEIHLP
jgi:hypothetical protein